MDPQITRAYINIHIIIEDKELKTLGFIYNSVQYDESINSQTMID